MLSPFVQMQEHLSGVPTVWASDLQAHIVVTDDAHFRQCFEPPVFRLAGFRFPSYGCNEFVQRFWRWFVVKVCFCPRKVGVKRFGAR